MHRSRTTWSLTNCADTTEQQYHCPTGLLHNMAEPIPSASNAGDDEIANKLPNNAEDRKAAAALNSLNANEMSQENGETATKQPSAADQEALGKAMSRLEIASGKSKKEDKNKKTDTKKEVEVKKKIKIVNEDVSFLVGTSL